VIAFGTYISEAEPYRRYAEPGIKLVAEPDSQVFPFAVVGQVGRSYNVILEKAAEHEDLEALVLVHPHTQIADPGFCTKVRQALADPEVGVVGCMGATGVETIAWWLGSVSAAPVVQRYTDYGGGDVSAFAWTGPGPAPAEVDTLDGFILVLSPWAVHNLRFDEELIFGYGFDLDFCLQVREAGKKVMTAPLDVIHHPALDVIPDEDTEVWIEAHMQLAEKWEGRMLGLDREEIDWKQRARRAEAEREAARAFAHGHLLGSDAQLLVLEREMRKVEHSLSWRLTEPLRRANLAAKRLRARRAQRA
jgi:hypothetical protein